MKDFESLDNVGMISILYDWFPDEIAPLLEHFHTELNLLLVNEEEAKKSWTNSVITFNRWLQLAEYANAKVEKYKEGMYKRKWLFIDQLFDQKLLPYSSSVVLSYANVSNNLSFRRAAALFFDNNKSTFKTIKERYAVLLRDFEIVIFNLAQVILKIHKRSTITFQAENPANKFFSLGLSTSAVFDELTINTTEVFFKAQNSKTYRNISFLEYGDRVLAAIILEEYLDEITGKKRT